MCTHIHTKIYFKKLPETCQIENYIVARRYSANLKLGDVPVDDEGKCLFHSNNLEWKRQQQCGERFLDLLREMANDETLEYLDFREFIITGGYFAEKESALLDNTFADDTVVLMGGVNLSKPLLLRGARFCDDLVVSQLSCFDIDFDEAIFKGVTTFIRSHFQDFTSFIGGARFEQNLVMEDCIFEQLVSLDRAVVMEQLFVTFCTFKGGISGLNMHQLASDIICQFSNVEFEAYSSFIDAAFQAPLVFDQCVFKGEMRFDNTRLKGRFQMKKPSVQEKIYFVSTDSERKIFENAVDFELEEDCFEAHGQLVFQNANLYNANPDFKEAIRTLELKHQIDIREGCFLYRNGVEKIFKYNRLTQALIEDVAKAFMRFFEANHARNLKVDVTRDLRKEEIRVIFHSDEAMDIEELRSLLDLGNTNLLTFFAQNPAPPTVEEPFENATDIWLQLQSIWQRCQMGQMQHLLLDFFNSDNPAIRMDMKEKLQVTMNIQMRNVMIGNTIQAGGNVIAGDVIQSGLSVDDARSLATHEIINNLLQLDTRLQLAAHAIHLTQEDSFTQDYETYALKLAPALSSNAGNNLRQLMVRTDVASLRHALNGHPLRHDLGRTLAEVFVKASLEEDNRLVVDYLKQFSEIQWAEESLLEAVSAFDEKSERVEWYFKRIFLAFNTVLNRSKIYHVHALRLLHTLEPSSNDLAQFQQLKILTPDQTLDEAAFTTYLLALVQEMSDLMQVRTVLLTEASQERDATLANSWATIEHQTTVHISDTWQEIIVKGRILRDLGRYEESNRAFEQIGVRFIGKVKNARKFAKIAVLFSKYIVQAGQKGGLFIQSVDKNSPAAEAGCRVGDVLLVVQHQPVTGMDELLNIQMKLPSGSPFEVQIARWVPSENTFDVLSMTILSKPFGLQFLPI